MSPLQWIDRALTLTRALGMPLILRAVLAGAPLAGAAILAFYLERVEGVRSVRPFLAILLVAAFCFRAFALGAVAYRFMRERDLVADPDLEMKTVRPPASPSATMSFAGLVAFVVGLHAVIAASVARFGGIALFFGALPLAFWGAAAPSWLARVRLDPDGGLPGLRRALGDMRGSRADGLLASIVLYLAQGVLLANVFVTLLLMVQAFHSFFGMNVASVSQFLSWENEFALVAVAAVVLVALEPYRMCLSIAVLVSASERRNGADLRRLIAALVVAMAFVGGVSPAFAQAPAADTPPTVDGSGLGVEDESGEVVQSRLETPYDSPPSPIPPGSPADERADAEVQRALDDILGRPEFREFRDAPRELGAEGEAPHWLLELLENLLEWLFGREHGAGGAPMDLPAVPTPPVGVLIALLVVLLAVVGGILYATRPRSDEEDDDVGRDEFPADPRDRPPEHHLAMAEALAREGRHREALRALYLATLVSLDRRREIEFDPSRTNWHYLRQIRDDSLRGSFRVFTGLFDRVWYGHDAATERDYERGLELIERLCATDARSPE